MAWLPKTPAIDEMQLPAFLRQTRRSRILDNPCLLITRVLAVVGAILVVERITSLYVFGSGKAVDLLQPSYSHPLDNTFTHHINNEGVGEHIPGETSRKAIIVASTTHEETQWVHDNFPDWQVNIFVVDNSSADLTIFKNRGREAAVYLTYLIQNYYNLPDYMVFLHADRYQWHNEDPMYDGVQPVKNLRLQHVRDVGYASLRCSWFPGCPKGLTPSLDGKDVNFGITHTYAVQFQEFFPDEPVPGTIGAPCCAQFALTREQAMIRQPWEFERIRQWLWDTGMGGGRSGRVLEYMWHKLFGMEDVSCPDAGECFCQKFGLCNLDCPDKRSCRGRFHMPPWNKGIPKGWPHYGQGTNGYPKWGWWQKWYPEEEFELGYAKEDYGVWNDTVVNSINSTIFEAEHAGPDDIDVEAMDETMEEVQEEEAEDINSTTSRQR